MDAHVARTTWRTVEPIHGAIYFVPEAAEEYAAVGLDDRMQGYFASRSAAMGPVGAEVVSATFFNFDPGLVRRSMDGVWDIADPATVLAARRRAADRMIRRLAPGAVDDDLIAEAATIATAAARAASDHLEGRPLFAGHVGLDWPDEPHLALWHAQTLLREYRGDGHIAALTAHGLSGCEALVTHGAAGDVPAEVLRSSRQRSDEDWEAAVESLRARGWLDDDGALTAAGRDGRAWIEDRTDELAVHPYAAIGEESCERLRQLARETSRAMATALGFARPPA
ncbi:MAG: hypothetical protein HKN44_15870 [Ilumatobacter sp.]|nr:hypothetical protein [Ilumatobacter sp.]